MRIARIFFDVDMRQSFEGLKKIAEDAKTDLSHTILFMNRKMTSFKILQQESYLVYFKNGNRRIPLDAIQHLPMAFGGSEFEFNRAIEKSLRSKLRLEV